MNFHYIPPQTSFPTSEDDAARLDQAAADDCKIARHSPICPFLYDSRTIARKLKEQKKKLVEHDEVEGWCLVSEKTYSNFLQLLCKRKVVYLNDDYN